MIFGCLPAEAISEIYYSLTLELIVLLISFRYLRSYCIPLLEIRQRTTRQNVAMYYFSLFCPVFLLLLLFSVSVLLLMGFVCFVLFNCLKRKGNVKYIGKLEVLYELEVVVL